MVLTKSGLALLAAMFMTGASAEESPMPEEIAWKLQELGQVIDPPNTASLYAPLQQKEPYPGARIERDVKYGPADRNLLDIFLPEAASGARPVLMFVHGGGFVAGNKRTGSSPFYDNIMLWALKNGFVGVNMTYRLAPQSPWPAAVEDVSAAVRWVAENIASRGGEPGRIYLMGHSAGAVHVATYVSHPEYHGPKGNGLAGAIIISAIYDVAGVPPSETMVAYFGTDTATYRERSSFDGLLKTKTPFMIAAAELDPPPFTAQFGLLKEDLCKSEHGCVRSLLLPQHSHMSEVYSINTADTRLTDQILEFVKAAK
jgi:acetyl esterase/lipase